MPLIRSAGKSSEAVDLLPLSRSAGEGAERSEAGEGRAIAAEIIRQTEARGAGGSICPSEVARALDPDWRKLLAPVRRAAAQLADAGRIDILRKGKPIAPADMRGVIRLRIKAGRMNPLAWLVSFMMPACGFAGAAGLPPPTLMDIAHIARPATPNTALAAPAGFRPTPDIVTPTYKVPADKLFAAVEAIAAAQPRTYPAATFAAERQVHYVVRSAVFNFPDLVTVQVSPAPPDGATLVLWSRSVYGEGDLGVNRKRVVAWLSALDTELNLPSER